jgi:hypothetical protein
MNFLNNIIFVQTPPNGMKYAFSYLNIGPDAFKIYNKYEIYTNIYLNTLNSIFDYYYKKAIDLNKDSFKLFQLCKKLPKTIREIIWKMMSFNLLISVNNNTCDVWITHEISFPNYNFPIFDYYKEEKNLIKFDYICGPSTTRLKEHYIHYSPKSLYMSTPKSFKYIFSFERFTHITFIENHFKRRQLERSIIGDPIDYYNYLKKLYEIYNSQKEIFHYFQLCKKLPKLVINLIGFYLYPKFWQIQRIDLSNDDIIDVFIERFERF